ncbi:MFS transporter [Chloroflexota bacterium]
MIHPNWKPSKIFYGWWVVGACFFIWLIESGFIILGFTAFFEPIANELGWSYTQISFASSLRGMEAGMLAPFLGLVVDRWGPRRLIFGGIVVTSIGLILFSYTTSLVMFYGAFTLLAIGLSGSSPTVTITAVAYWFRKKLGLVTGIVTSGFALGGLIVPIVVRLIDILDWRTTIFILGLLILAIGLPLSLLIRHKPEKYGYLPDGEQNNTVTLHEDLMPIQTTRGDIGAMQALTSRTFWQIGLTVTFLHLAVSSVTLHVMPYLSSVGISRSTSSLVVMSIPLVSIIGRLGSGWLGDKFDKKQVTYACLALTSLGLLFFNYLSNEVMWLLVPFIILFGIGWGGTSTIRMALLMEYFGKNRFGTIMGFTMAMASIGNILGPLFAGWVFDNWGSYNNVWLVLACFTFTAIILIKRIPMLGTNRNKSFTVE